MQLTKEKIQNISLIVFAITIFGLFTYMSYPYLNVFALALIFSIIVNPINRYFMRETKFSTQITSLLSMIIAVLIVIVPIVFIVITLLSDALEILRTLNIEHNNISNNLIASYNELLSLYNLNELKISQMDLNNSVRDISSTLSSSVLDSIKYLLKISYNSIIDTIMFFIFSYMLITYWDKFVIAVQKATPLHDDVKEIYFRRLNLITWDVIRGSFLLALVQGFAAGVMLFAFGVPNTLIWIFLIIIFAMIPVVGPSLIMVPIALYYFFIGDYFTSACIFLWQIFVVSTIDNLLRPFIISQEIRINPIIIFFAFVAGIIAFGPMGIFYGPIIMILFLTTLEVISKIYWDHDISFFIYTKTEVQSTNEGITISNYFKKLMDKVHHKNL